MRPSVLITEDDASIRMLVRKTLGIGDVEFDLYEADSGAGAVELTRRVRPGIIVMDISMPGEFDGLEACRRIKGDPALERTVVIMLTASNAQQDCLDAKAAGADAYLVKPFSPLKLLDMVSEFSASN